ncbi:alpha/beta hydrolase [Aeromicrobium sp. CF4.19]|uniref:alpha/beta hydrolase n=1 Tax=Aeromicrobium sp. CF4.19 TaxID=3373082 RepID=UPI003EE72412
MGLYADFHAWLSGSTARWTVRYGDSLRLGGLDVADPATWRVPTRHGEVPCEVYRPSGVEGPLPVLVHLHGGAFIMRHPRMDDFWCRFVAAEAGVAVVNVDYAVAPRHRYPVAHEQVHDVIAWVQQRAADQGLDGGRLGVSGFSAGGNLAASACLRARDEQTFTARLQLLGVPSLDVSTSDKPSTLAHPMISPRTVRLVRAAYFKDETRRTEPYASPALAGSLTGLPPAMVLTAEHDALRAEGDGYAHRLRAAGVEVEHVVVPRRDHYFLDGSDPTQARGLMGQMASAVRRHLR